MLAIQLIKWLFGFLFAVAVVIVLAIIIVPRVFDPNDYREQITQLVQDNTGRELKLNGDLSVSVFPWLGIRTQGLSLSQPVEIGGQMVEVDTAQLRVKLMPLLSKRVEVDTVVLEKPQLRFVTLQNGISSLSGLLDDAQDPQPNEPSPDLALAIVIQGVRLSDGSLEWDDRQSGQHYQLNNLQLATGNLIGDELAAVDLRATILDMSDAGESSPALDLSLTGQARIDTESLLLTAQSLSTQINYGDYQLSANIDDIIVDSASSTNALLITVKGLSSDVDYADLQFSAKADGLTFDSETSDLQVAVIALNADGQLSDQKVQGETKVRSLSYNMESTRIAIADVNLVGDYGDFPLTLSVPAVDANLNSQTASITSSNFQSADLTVAVKGLRVAQFIDNLTATGSLTIDEFDAVALLDRLKIDYTTSDPKALKKVALSTSFSAGLDQLALSTINLSLDDTRLKGDFSARDFAAPALKFNLLLDSINLDRYMSASATNDGEGASAGGAQALLVPMALFKDINANGSFKAGKLISSGVELTDIDVQIESSPGMVTVTPKANLYDGELTGSMVYTETDGTSQLHVQNRVGVVDLTKFLTAADVTDQLSGFGEVDLDIVVTERDGVQSNQGTIKLLAKDGAVKGVDIKGIVDKAYSAYATYQQLSGKSSDATQANTGSGTGAAEQSDETGFTDLFGTFILNNFKLSNNDFKVNAPLFRISGQGDIDLAAQNLDYGINVAIVNSAAGQGGASLENLRGITLPIKLSGSLLAPNYALDTKAMYNALAKAKVDDKKTEYLQEKFGIEDGGKLSTKDVLRELLIKEVEKDENKNANADSPALVEPQTAETGNGAPTTDAVDANTAEAEPSTEAEPPKTKKELRDERNRKLLEGLFN